MIALGIGLIFSLICLVYIHARLHKDLQETRKYGLDLFDQPIDNDDLEDVAGLKIIQALWKEGALAKVISRNADGNFSAGINVYIHHSPKHPYYDEQLVNVPRGTHMVQVGVYSYVSVSDAVCTVPAISPSSADLETSQKV